jgi:hypothetical protein
MSDVRYQENKCQERTQNQLTTQSMKIKNQEKNLSIPGKF